MRFPGGEVLIGYGYDAGAFSGRRCWPLATASSLYALRLQAEAAAKER